MELDSTMPGRFVEEQRRRVEENRRPDFYDVTAWSLPLAFNLETWTTEEAPAVGSEAAELAEPAGPIRGEGGFGYMLRPQGIPGYRWVAGLLSEKVLLRLAVSSTRIGE